MDLETFLVLLFVRVDDWISNVRPCEARRPGRSPLLSDGEVLTLAILSQWPRFAHLYPREYFPTLVGQCQLNRRIRPRRRLFSILSLSFEASTLTIKSKSLAVRDKFLPITRGR
jgi:hypothetical protein